MTEENRPPLSPFEFETAREFTVDNHDPEVLFKRARNYKQKQAEKEKKEQGTGNRRFSLIIDKTPDDIK